MKRSIAKFLIFVVKFTSVIGNNSALIRCGSDVEEMRVRGRDLKEDVTKGIDLRTDNHPSLWRSRGPFWKNLIFRDYISLICQMSVQEKISIIISTERFIIMTR